MKDTTNNPDYYFEFYEELAQKCPETTLMYENRGLGSRYWTVRRELRRFARSGAKLLDVGCNDGVYTIPYCQNGGRALGVDICPTLIQRAHESATCLELQCRFMEADIESVNITQTLGEYFDVVLFSEVLEHLLGPEQALRNIHKLLVPGGCLILTTPTPLFSEFSVPTTEYVSTMLNRKKLLESYTIDTTKDPIFRSYGVSPYLWRHDGYYPRALREYVESVGFRCVRFYTIGFVHLAVKKILVTLFKRLPISYSSSPAVERDSIRGQSWMMFRRGYRLFIQLCELMLRKVPLINLFGVTNIGIFHKPG